ncbi:MAG: hypothetical protein ISS47_06630 [Candidatus Omnitrophica bacterium]|nr:hypothetical protein [Candidatus Omnitrophota bacterium]
MLKGTFRELQKVDQEIQKFNCNKIADRILSEHRIIYSASDFYEYKDGFYKLMKEVEIKKYVKDILGENYSSNRANEVLHSIETEIYKRPEELNNTEYLNLVNGLFDMKAETIKPHDPDVLSTIQLDVTYKEEADCKKWIKTIYEIFEGNESKVNTLQEFFGLCLTKDTMYDKALFMIGEGSNGKSTVLYVLEHILGLQNKISIPLEKLSDLHYVASLFNKLVNISIETHSKSSVYDATFKQIVSGDSLTADSKYKHPFTFRPYCKLIYALNNMPRVEDKTHAFYRRLLILRFNRQFSEKDANKKLRQELLEEKDGIFRWMLEGYRNLSQRGHFKVDEEMSKAIEEYRADNNNVLLFVEDDCVRDPSESVTKKDLYQGYCRWCSENGHKSLSQNKFGKELAKQYKDISSERDRGGHRSWFGIRLENLRY